MSKIIGVTVGTSMNPQKVVEKTKLEERVDKLSEDVKDLKANGTGGTVEGLVEITDGEPTKEGTVLTVNPNAEEVNLCTEEDFNAFKAEINAKFNALVNGNEVAY